MAVTWKKLAYADDVVLKTLFDAQSILAAVTNDTPAAITISEEEIVGRITAGNITGLSAAEVLTLIGVEAGADVTDATNVAAAGAVMESDFGAKGDVLVGTGAGTATVLGVADASDGWVLTVSGGAATGLEWRSAGAPAAHATSHKNGGSDEILLNELGEPTGAVAFYGQQATNFVVQNVADETARLALTPVLGKAVFQVDELSPYICTVIA